MRRAVAARKAVRRRANPASGSLGTEPVSRLFGHDRGTPIDRVWIERFLLAEADRIRGSVLEIGDAAYTRQFGKGVSESHVLHATSESPEATIVGDLATGAGLSDASFDCIVLTQTLPFIFDIEDAVKTCRRALRPGGSVLATLPGISQISRYDMDRWGDFWRFTDASARRLFASPFGDGDITVRTHGNVGSACAFLQGLSAEEVDADLLDAVDPDYQVLITVVGTAPAS